VIPDWVIWILVGAASLGKFLYERQRDGKASSPSPVSPPPAMPEVSPAWGRGNGESSDEERRRRFKKALGLPPEEEPPVRKLPVPAEPKSEAPLPKIAPPNPWAAKPPKPRPSPPAPSAPTPPVVYSEPVPVIPPKPSETPLQEAEAAVRTAGRISSSLAPSSAPARAIRREAPMAALIERLHHPDALRTAFLMGEILGPPKALQSER
jgi:hypothetical protein